MNLLLSTLLVLGAIQSCDGLKFTIPIFSYHEWSVINNAFKDIIGPLHHEMSTNNISPRVAGEQFSLLLGTFLESHPEFVAHEASDKYQQHEPNTLVKARKIKKCSTKEGFQFDWIRGRPESISRRSKDCWFSKETTKTIYKYQDRCSPGETLPCELLEICRKCCQRKT